MCDSNHLVLLILQRLLDLIKLRPVADWCLELCCLDSVCLEAVCKRVGKVASVENKHLITRLNQVGRDLIPAERAGAGDDNGLRCRVGSLEELAQVLEDFAEAVYKGCADVRFTGILLTCAIVAIDQCSVPVVAHGVENCIVKLNGPRDEQRGVWLLVRHLLGYNWLCLLHRWFRSLFLFGLLFLGFGPFYRVSAVVFESRASFGGKRRV
jgi:hypothetical protein